MEGMSKLIPGDAKGFFSPQEGGACKITVMFEDKESQDRAFLLRNKPVLIGLRDIDIPAPAEPQTVPELKAALAEAHERVRVLTASLVLLAEELTAQEPPLSPGARGLRDMETKQRGKFVFDIPSTTGEPVFLPGEGEEAL